MEGTIWTFIVALIGIIGSIITPIFEINRKKTSNDKSIEKELKNLDDVSKSLEGLRDFIDKQKENLIENEAILQRLEKKRDELKPLVETQEKTIEAILIAHSNNQKKSRWFNYLMGFFIGVASSALVTMVFYYFQTG